MARPRSFEPADVEEALLGVFWSRGYARTSIDELTSATGLLRGSLYGAYGSKEEMFCCRTDGERRVEGPQAGSERQDEERTQCRLPCERPGQPRRTEALHQARHRKCAEQHPHPSENQRSDRQIRKPGL